MRRILVPLDGSPSAEQAIPFAARLARQSAGAVLLVRVLREPRVGRLPSASRASWTFLIQTWADIAATYLTHAAAHPALRGIEVETGIANGDEARSILALARARQVDVIVLSGQAVTAGSDWGLGEVAQRVIRAAEVPVLAVPQDGASPGSEEAGSIGAPSSQRPLRALVALDGSPHAEAALDLALPVVAGLAAPRPGALHLLHVAADGEAAQDGKAYLSSVAHDLRVGPFADLLLAPTWSVARDHDVVRAVLAQASRRGNREDSVATTVATTAATADLDHPAGRGAPEGEGDGDRDSERHGEVDDEPGGEIDASAVPGADLIVMATYGRRGPAGWEAERIVADVLRLATCPVLVTPPPLDDTPALWSGEAYAGALNDASLADAEATQAGGVWW